MTGVYSWGWGDGPRAAAFWGWAEADSAGVGCRSTPYRVVPASGVAAVADTPFRVLTNGPAVPSRCTVLPPVLIPVAAASEVWPKVQATWGRAVAAGLKTAAGAVAPSTCEVAGSGGGGKPSPRVDASRGAAAVSRSGDRSKAVKG